MTTLVYFLGSDFLDVIVLETNRYASQIRRDTPNPAPHSFAAKWYPTDRNEFKQFLGLMFLLGIVKKPAISD